jgi:hypothetical protein
MKTIIWYWIDKNNTIQTTEDATEAEKAFKEHGHIYGCNKMEVELGLLGMKK